MLLIIHYIIVEVGGYKFSVKTKFKYNASKYNVSADPGGNPFSSLGKSDRHWQHMLLLTVSEETEPGKQHEGVMLALQGCCRRGSPPSFR